MRKLFNKRFVALLLTLAMVLSLVPAFGSVEAQAAIADDADVIRLPITIRDANQDNVLFENTNFNNKDEYIPTTIVDGVPQYNEAAIQRVASLIVDYRDYGTRYPDQNTYLYDALQIAEGKASNWSNTTSGADVTYLEDAPTAYSAAKWMLSHLFVDGQYYADQATGVGEFDASKNYTKTYPGYEELVLQKDSYSFTSGRNTYTFDCYSYKSKNAQTNFVAGDDQIHNVTSGGSSYSNGGWYPLENLGFKQMTSENSWGGSGSSHNFHTTTAGSGQFVYHEADDLFFAFTGDDDVFLYINDVLVINDGGIHGEEYSRIFLEQPISNTTYRSNAYTTGISNTSQTWAEYLGLEEGKIYNFNFFQMERNRTDSNFAIYTNINVVDSSAVPQKRVYQNGQELIYGSFVPQNSEVTYGFELTNNGGVNGAPIKDLTFVDAMLGVNLSKTETVIDNDDATVTTYADLEYAIYKIGETPVYTKLTNETGAETLKSLLTAGIESGYTFAIRGFKYNVGAPADGATTKTISNTVQTTAVGTANNSAAEKILRGNASVRVRTWDILNKTFVMDYAKTMNLTNEQVFGTELVELNAGISVQEVIGSDTVRTEATLEDEVNGVSLDKTTGVYGNMELTGSSISDYGLAYTPTRFINGMDSFIVKIDLETTTTTTDESGNVSTVQGTNTMNKSVSIVPANNVYYEDSFAAIEYTGVGETAWEIVYNNNGSDGSSDNNTEIPEGIEDSVHGWIDSLSDDSAFSDGSAHVISESGAKASFTFTGTGVDIYSRTNSGSGIVTAMLFDINDPAAPALEKYLIIDNLAVSGDYYQIPTLSFDNLDANTTYRLDLYVNNAKVLDENGEPVKNNDGSFQYRSTYYLDGIRVYNPMGATVNGKTSSFVEVNDLLDAAAGHAAFIDLLYTKEAFELTQNNEGRWNYTKDGEVIFISDEDYDSNAYVVDGKSYIDIVVSSQAGVADYFTTDVYNTYGPKNEVYLAKGQSITFAVQGTGDTYVGLKSLTGATVAEITNGTEKIASDIKHTTDLYYAVTPAEGGLITIRNGGENLLAVTKIQLVSDATATFALRMISNDEALAYANTFAELPVTEDEVEVVEPTEPETPEVDVEIDNPDPEPEPEPTPDPREGLRNLVRKLFGFIIGLL